MPSSPCINVMDFRRSSPFNTRYLSWSAVIPVPSGVSVIFASLGRPLMPSSIGPTVIPSRFVDWIVTSIVPHRESSSAKYAWIVAVPPRSAWTATLPSDVFIPPEFGSFVSTKDKTLSSSIV